MRKSAAIFLLTCFGLYHLGFFAVQFLMPMAIHQHWENQIWVNDEDFLEGKLIRIPFAMPYGQNQENFQSVNFSMEIEGKMNRVIKQRYFEDHLEVVVVEDELQTKLDEQVKLWIYSLSSGQTDFDGPPIQKVLLKSFVKDFVPQALDFFLFSKYYRNSDSAFFPFFIQHSAGNHGHHSAASAASSSVLNLFSGN